MDLEEYMTKQMAAYKLDPDYVAGWTENIHGLYGIVRAPFNPEVRMRKILRHGVGLLIMVIANKPYDLHRVESNLFWTGHPQTLEFNEGIEKLVSLVDSILDNFLLGLLEKEKVFTVLLTLAKMAANELQSLATLADADGMEIEEDLRSFHNLPPTTTGGCGRGG